jgi:enterochelin esterase-like enzyme
MTNTVKAVALGLILSFATSAVTGQERTAPPCKHTVTGELQVFRFDSKIFGNTRMLRVWLPPGYADVANQSKRYPVLYMFDGQDLFDACTGPDAKYEWQVDETMTRLIAEGKVEPMIVVGIDHAGERRLIEYVPWRDFMTPEMPEPEGRRMPDFMLHEVLPVIEAKYRIAKGAENTGIGGSSAGAVAAVYVAQQAPLRFGRLLAESVVPWFGNGQLVRDSANIGIAPERVWFGVGGKEAHYPGWHMTDAMQKMIQQIASNFRAAPLRPSEVKYVVDPDGGHNVEAWAKRFPDAVLFLFGHPPPSSTSQ